MTTAGPRVAWSPNAGSQALFLSCPIFECLFEGTRGPGKTDALLMDFARDVGMGHGAAWRGILFREEATQLQDVIEKSHKWFPRIFPGARFIEQPKNMWVFPEGEKLLFRHARTKKDYNKYHGHEYPWIGWEELTNWATSDVYKVMKSLCRSSTQGVPRRIRATTNPHGRGHNWVKAMFIDPAPPGVPFETEDGLWCVRIHGHYSENKPLMEASPDYASVIAAAATSPEQEKAWLSGDWDIVAGGMFDDVWSRERQVLDPFPIPKTWRIDRSYDWGSAKPFSVGWWAESDGTRTDDMPEHVHFPKGSIVRIGEWYGWNGKDPNVGVKMTDSAIGEGIREREEGMGLWGRVHPGPADSTIFSADPGQETPAKAMEKHGITFVPANKEPGSRVRGWAKCREMLKASKENSREDPGMWVFNTCRQFIRTIPTLPRSDKNPDDLDTESEDHIADESRYRAARKTQTARVFDFEV